jgi:ATP-dependent Clp protease ATP-binding subunit ClpC
MKEKVMDEVKRLFKPEFLNRIDDIIVFHVLGRDDIGSIVDIMMASVNARTMEQMRITLEMSAQAKEFLVDKGYDSKYGARPLRRAIQNYVEDPLAEKILDGTIKQGNKVNIVLKDGKLDFEKKRGYNR